MMVIVVPIDVTVLGIVIVLKLLNIKASYPSKDDDDDYDDDKQSTYTSNTGWYCYWC